MGKGIANGVGYGLARGTSDHELPYSMTVAVASNSVGAVVREKNSSTETKQTAVDTGQCSMMLQVKKGVWMFSHESSNHPNATAVNWKSRMSCALPLFPDDSTGRSGMCMLRKVKGQHQRFRARVHDLHTTI